MNIVLSIRKIYVMPAGLELRTISIRRRQTTKEPLSTQYPLILCWRLILMVHCSNPAGVIYNIPALVFPYMYILYILLQHYLLDRQ